MKLANWQTTLTVIIGAIASIIGGLLKIDISQSIQLGFIMFINMLVAWFSKDGWGETDQKTTITGAVGFVGWLITAIFKIEVTPEVMGLFITFVLAAQAIFAKGAIPMWGSENLTTTVIGLLGFIGWLLLFIFNFTIPGDILTAFSTILVFVIGIFTKDKEKADSGTGTIIPAT